MDRKRGVGGLQELAFLVKCLCELFLICRQLGFAKGGAVTSFKGREEVGVEQVSVSSSLSYETILMTMVTITTQR